jgi:glycosyltransferase involved in cell wall biosynthesis
MRFVHVEDTIIPDAGYQINSLTHLQSKQGHEVFIVAGELEKIPSYLTAFFGKDNTEKKDQQFFERTGVKIIRIPLRGFYSGRAIPYKKKLFNTVKSLNPDVVYVHGEDTLIGMQFIWNYSKLNFPIVLDCHMLEMASINRFRNLFRYFYRTFITPKIRKYNIPLIRTVDSDFVQKCLGIPLEKTALLPLGTDTSFFKPDEKRYTTLREKYGIPKDDFVIIYAGKLDEYKGGTFFAKSIKEKIISKNGRDVTFVIVGNTVGEYGKEVERIFSTSENNVIRFPTQTYYDLLDFYQMVDLSVFPKQCSLSFFEVQACAVPIVFETNEINCKRAAFENAFTFIAGDKTDFRQKIMDCIDMSPTQYAIVKQNARKYVQDNFDYVPIAQKTSDLMINEYNKYHRIAK